MASKKRLRIMFVIGSLDIGGAEIHLSNIAKELVQFGFDLTIVSFKAPGKIKESLIESGIRVIFPDKSKMDRFPRFLLPTYHFFFLFWKMATLRPLIAHFFLPYAYLIGGITSILCFIPIKIMSRRSRNFYQQKHKTLSLLEKTLHRFVTVALANSKIVEQDLIGEQMPNHKIRLIYNGIGDVNQKAKVTVSRETLGICKSDLVFIKVANLIPYKGHVHLLRALHCLSHQIDTNWRLICVGEDRGILPDLKDMAVDLGIDQNILWVGGQEDVPTLLSLSDIGVLCSDQEGFSNAVLEYMRSGLPSIVTDVGGNAEAILHKESGLVVPKGAPIEIANALLTLVSDGKLRKKMGSAAIKRQKERFSLTECVGHYAALYQELAIKHSTHL